MTQPKLLSGGNPQIPKGEGNAPVQAYLDAMPRWKQQIGLLIDRLVVETVPGVAKAVKWNTPLYGLPGEGWFLAFHCFDKYVKVTFFQGMSLEPIPPGKSKQPQVRYLDIRERDEIDEARLVQWIAQASALPGERL
jgi:hypothetical protein